MHSSFGSSSSSESDPLPLSIPLPVHHSEATLFMQGSTPQAAKLKQEPSAKPKTHEPNGSHLDSSTSSSTDEDIPVPMPAVPADITAKTTEESGPQRGLLASIGIYFFKWIVIVFLFALLITCVRATCCVSFSLFPFSCSMYFSLREAAEREGGGLAAFIGAIQVDHVWNETLQWWNGVQQCLVRY